MKKILYVGYYDKLRTGKQIRNYSLAAAKKMDFIAEIIHSLGFQVEIVSPAHIKIKSHPCTGEIKEQIEPGINLALTPSWGAKHKPARVARVLYSKLWLFWYLLKNARRGDSVVVYHNYNLALPVIFAQKIKGFQIVLEVEEIYSKVWKLTKLQQWKEQLLLKYAGNRSLVVSDVLAEELGVENPAISYGSYTVCTNPPLKAADGMIHLILTGSVDRERGNGFLAVEAMRYLPDNYKLFISGPVAAKDREDFLNLIRSVNEEQRREACAYLGLLDDRAYKGLLLSADIALNPQRDGEFGKYVFPSKILTYFGYGLPVVSTRGESIVKSKLADLITFADGFDGKSVADAIQNVVVRDRTVYQARLDELRGKFLGELANTLGNEDKHEN